MKQSGRITSEILISMKDRTNLTVEQISSGAGIPLATAQKIFAGITKTPRASSARVLYNYLLRFVEEAELPEKEENRGGFFFSGQAQQADGVSETPAPYGASGGKGGRKENPGSFPSSYIVGNLARTIRKPGEYTMEDYHALPDDQRCELIDGFFYDMASPSAEHQRISAGLTAALFNYIHERGGECEVFTAPFEVQLDCDDKTVVQPDLSVICNPERVQEWGVFGAPDLVIEILSPATERRDRSLKTMKYADAGVREYWIIDPMKRRIYVHLFEAESAACIYSFAQEVPVGIYGGDLKICLGSWIARGEAR